MSEFRWAFDLQQQAGTNGDPKQENSDMQFRRQNAWATRSFRHRFVLLLAGDVATGPGRRTDGGARREAARWTAAKFGGVAESPPGRPPLTTEPPFSFKYDGKSSGDLPWQPARASRKLDDQRTEHTLTYADGKTGLQVRCVAVEYHDFPAVEWTAYFKNAGTSDTPILENIQGLDARFERGADGEFVLHGIKGDFCTADSFEPYRRTLAANTVTKFAPPGSGKSSDGPEGWPYFNLQFPGGGVILAVGWPGQWASSFTRDDAARAAHPGRAGTHPPASETRRGDPHAADGLAVLAGGGRRGGAEPLAALVRRAQHAAGRWEDAAGGRPDPGGGSGKRHRLCPEVPRCRHPRRPLLA